MKPIIYSLILTALVFSCSNAKTEQADNSQQPKANTTTGTQSNVISDYMALKDAFVQSDIQTVKSLALDLVKTLEVQNVKIEIIEAARSIASNEDLDQQRIAFKTVTDGLIEEWQSNDAQTIYVQYCPMAFDNTGANWLSLSEEIRNPYFGDKMLTCGRVEKTL